MADNRTFLLIGNFQDNITGPLKSINKQIETLSKSFKDLQKDLKPLTKEFKELAEVGKDFGKNLRDQSKDTKEYVRNLREMRRELDRTSNSYRKMSRGMLPPAGGGRGGRGGGYGGYIPPMPPRGSGRNIYGGGSQRGGGYAAPVAGAIVGTQIASVVEGAIVSGFRIGTDIMMKPFQYFANSLGERIEDEMSDIKAAGGFFSIAKRQKDPFVTSLDDSIKFTQENNRALAKMAAALPGSTREYVQVSKRLGDTIARVVGKDLQGAIEESNKIRRTEQGAKFYGGEIRETGGKRAQQQAIQTLLGELTKKTVLAGQGGGRTAGGMMGAYGLPGIAERLIAEENVSVGRFQRYAAIFGDPMIQDALTRNIEAINQTQMNSIERYQAIQAMFDEIVTPEYIEKVRRSVSGITESLRSAIFDPEVGIFGIGRKFEGIAYQLNDFGQYVNEAGDAVTDLTKAAKVDLSLFEMLRDIFAQVGQVIAPIIESMPMIWDPLRQITDVLQDARHYTAELLRTFHEYREGLKAFAEGLGGDDQFRFMETLNVRASLAALNNLFAEFGVYGKETEKTFASVANMLKDPDANIGEILNNMINTFFSSEIAKNIGSFLGELIGTVLKQVADATSYISNVVEGGGFAGGFVSAFKKAKGFESIQTIFVSIIKAFAKAIGTAIVEMPILSATVAALFLLPAVIGSAVSLLVQKAISMVATGGSGVLQKLLANMFKVKPVTVTDMGGPITDPSRLLPAGKGGGALAKDVVKGKGWFGNMLKNLKGFGKSLPALTKLFAKFNAAFSILDFVMRKMSGQSTGEAAGGAAGGLAGGILGGAIGTAIAPGIGTAIGSVLGTFIGGWIGEKLPAFFASLPSKLESGIANVRSWFLTLPETLGGWLGATYSRFVNWIQNELPLIWETLKGQLSILKNKIQNGVSNFIEDAGKVLSDPSTWSNLAMKLLEGIKTALENSPLGLVVRGAMGVGDAISRTTEAAKTGATVQDAVNVKPREGQTRFIDGIGTMVYKNGNWVKAAASGHLGDAIASEMKNKPRGSNLVIANSSETVIPAAGGYGMKSFMDLLASGFSLVEKQYRSLDKKNENRSEETNSNIDGYQKINQAEFTKINQELSQIYQVVSKISSTGGLLGGMGMDLGGGYGSAGGAIAGKLGDFIKATGGAPGSIHEHPAHGGVKGRHAPGSYHYSGRAIDIGAYAHEQAGVIARIKQFNAKMGVKPVEFLHAGNDPNHQDHVHVAYALGKGNPAFFRSQSAAEMWERSMVRGSVKVGSITGNSAEGFGGSSIGTINVTVNAGSTSDPEELASIVALKIGEAVADARASSVFV